MSFEEGCFWSSCLKNQRRKKQKPRLLVVAQRACVFPTETKRLSLLAALDPYLCASLSLAVTLGRWWNERLGRGGRGETGGRAGMTSHIYMDLQICTARQTVVSRAGRVSGIQGLWVPSKLRGRSFIRCCVALNGIFDGVGFSFSAFHQEKRGRAKGRGNNPFSSPAVCLLSDLRHYSWWSAYVKREE